MFFIILCLMNVISANTALFRINYGSLETPCKGESNKL